MDLFMVDSREWAEKKQEPIQSSNEMKIKSRSYRSSFFFFSQTIISVCKSVDLNSSKSKIWNFPLGWQFVSSQQNFFKHMNLIVDGK